MGRIIMITGGVRSGKSRHALKIAKEFSGTKVFIATGTASDPEMSERIANHKSERGDIFTTIEEPRDPAKVISEAAGRDTVIILDCLTLWVNNLIDIPDETAVELMDEFLSSLKTSNAAIIVITNEVGSGIIPANELSRKYSDQLGRLNQNVAAIADDVIHMVSGLPQILKSV